MLSTAEEARKTSARQLISARIGDGEYAVKQVKWKQKVKGEGIQLPIKAFIPLYCGRENHTDDDGNQHRQYSADRKQNSIHV